VSDTPGYRFLGAHDVGGDVLRVTYHVDGEEAPRTVLGWVSATTNHYDPETYCADRENCPERDEFALPGEHRLHRLKGSKPRKMTSSEMRVYAESLIEAARAPEPVELVAADPEPE